MAAVRIPPTLRAEVGGARELEADGDTVAEVIDDLVDRYPPLGAQLLQDGELAPFVNVYVGRRGRPHARRPRHRGAQRRPADPPPRDGGWKLGRRFRRRSSTSSGRRRSSSSPVSRRSRPSVSTRSSKDRTRAGRSRIASRRRCSTPPRRPGELEPGGRLLEPTSGNTGIALALAAKLRGYPLTCVVPSNVTAERRRLLGLYGAEIVDSPGAEGSNGAVRLALELAAADSTYFMPFQYANEANPRAHYDGTGAEIAAALDRVDVLVAGLGTGGTLMGAGERLRETFPDVSSRPPSRFRATRSWACGRSRTATCRRSSTCRSSTGSCS